MPIDTPADLRAHVQTAIGIELTTIPPYLYAMHSIEDPASTASKYLRSIATEEMLHAVLMANVLLGLGGEPRFYDRDMVPVYPCTYPHRVPDLPLHLAPCSVEIVATTFMGIERPHELGAPPQDDDFTSLGQFYVALERAIVRLDPEHDLFSSPQRERQLLDPQGYLAVKYDDAASGGLVAIDSVETALAATDVAIHQGEGVSDVRYADPTHRELTHHAKFASIAEGSVEIGPVRPAVLDPSVEQMPADVAAVARLTDALYCYTFVLIDRLLAPAGANDQTGRHRLVGLLYGSMVALLGPLCRHLMTIPTGDGQVWGPPFGFHEFDDPARAEDELRAMAQGVAAHFPQLSPVMAQFDRLP